MARMARAAGAGDIVVAATPGIRFTPVRSSPETDAAAGRFEDRVAKMDFRPNRGSVFSAHQMGTVRMGASARDHPCDPNGRVRARGRRERLVGGLYVADASLFPTAIGVNPMLTVMALARRVARTVLADLVGRRPGARHPPTRGDDERHRHDDHRAGRMVRGSIGSLSTIAPRITATTGLT